MRLPQSVTATIKYRNLVGQRYIALDAGRRADERGYLAAGATIPLARTQPALDLTELFNGFKPLFQALSPDDVNQLSYEIIQVFQGEGDTVDSLLANTAQLTTTIADKDKVIGQVIDNLNTVLDTVNAHSTQLSGLITTTQQLVSGLAADRQPISDAIGSLGRLADTTAGLLDQGRAPLRTDIASLGYADQEPQRQPGHGRALHPVPAHEAVRRSSRPPATDRGSTSSCAPRAARPPCHR